MLCPHAPDSHRSHAISHQGGRGYDKGAVDGKILGVLSDFDDINDSIALKNVAAKASEALEEASFECMAHTPLTSRHQGACFSCRTTIFWK